MADKKLSIVVSAKNAVQAGLDKAKKAVSDFGSKVGGWFKKAFAPLASAKAQLVGIVASVVSVGKALQAWSVQEVAEKRLTAALEAHGEAADKLLPKLKAIASAIQDQTAAGDEATLELMARLRLLGVHTDKLGDAAKAAIAMEAAGLQREAASKAIAMAMQGEYTMLNRYLPALRRATDEAEKARIVNDFVSKAYATQKAVLNTTSGAWKALRGRIGDALEEIGRAIDKSGGIQAALHRAGDAVKRFGEAIVRWVDSEAFERVQQGIQAVINAMRSSEGRKDVLQIGADYLKSVFTYGFETIKEGAIFLSAQIAAGIKSGLPKVLGGSKEQAGEMRKNAALRLGYEVEFATGRMERRNKEIASRLEKYRVEARKEAQREIEQINIAAADKEGILAKQAAAAEKEAAAARLKEHENLNKKKLALEKELTAALKEQQREVWQNELEQNKQKLAAAEELAKKSVKDFIEENRARAAREKAKAKQDAKDARRAQILEERLKGGGRLDEKQQEWLDAFRQIDKARKAVGPLKDQIKVAQENLKVMAKQTRSLSNIERDIGMVENKIERLLTVQ